MAERDPMNVLAQVTAMQRAALPPAPDAETVIRRVTQTPKRRPWWRRFMVIGAITATAGAGTVAWAILTNDVEHPTELVCYGAPSVDATRFAVVAEGADPVRTCADEWPSSVLGPDPAPPLTACVSGEGVISVFPGEATVCAELELAAYTDDTLSPENQTIVELDRTLAVALSERGCVPLDDVEQMVRGQLDLAGLDDWSIERRGNPSE